MEAAKLNGAEICQAEAGCREAGARMSLLPFRRLTTLPSTDNQAQAVLAAYTTSHVGGRLVFERTNAPHGTDWAAVGGCITAECALGLTVWVSDDCSYPPAAFDQAARCILRKGPLVDVRA